MQNNLSDNSLLPTILLKRVESYLIALTFIQLPSMNTKKSVDDSLLPILLSIQDCRVISCRFEIHTMT